MIWKKRGTNIVIVSILTFIYTIVGLLTLIGPLHTNASGAINQLNNFPYYIICYWLLSLVFSWTLYFSLERKPALLFFMLIISAIVIIFAEIYFWHLAGL